jgi:Conserved in the green lineage and diatoms 27
MKSPAACPVPLEQRPVNEFRELSESRYFRWATLNGWDFLKPLAIAFSLTFLISAPTAAASYPIAHYPLQWLLIATAGATLIPLFLLIRLYLGWNYIKTRLLAPKIFYEESGWYDGQIWEKTPDFLNQDKLIVTYEVQPILQKLQQVLIFTIGLLLGLTLASILWAILD